jgi:hypothetical protein
MMFLFAILWSLQVQLESSKKTASRGAPFGEESETIGACLSKKSVAMYIILSRTFHIRP